MIFGLFDMVQEMLDFFGVILFYMC